MPYKAGSITATVALVWFLIVLPTIAEGEGAFRFSPPPEEYGNLLSNWIHGENGVEPVMFPLRLRKQKQTSLVCHLKVTFPLHVCRRCHMQIRG